MNQHQSVINNLLNSANQVLLGKQDKIKLALAALFANGHLLINDLPGVGKTTLANILAKLFDLDFQRIQFTSDLLPADITGVSIFNQKTSRFEFHAGPVFAQLVLADEINRATPKTQSALLEAMEEKQVTIEGHTRELPRPFFVIATQNPGEQAGTFVLPESQLDRFLLSINIGYPDARSERQMLTNQDPRSQLRDMVAVASVEQLIELQQATQNIHCADAIVDYVQDIVSFTRQSQRFSNGYSPRAAMGLLKIARAWALIAGRDIVLPEDIQAIIPSTLHHLRSNGGRIDAQEDLLKSVAIR